MTSYCNCYDLKQIFYYQDFVLRIGFIEKPAIGLMSRVFANGQGDWGSIPVIQKTQKMVVDAPCLTFNIIR